MINKLKLRYHNFRFRHTKDIDSLYKLLLKWGYIQDDCTPIKCTHCGSTKLKEINHEFGGYNIPEGVLCEFEVVCSECGQNCGHWAYGGWSL